MCVWGGGGAYVQRLLRQQKVRGGRGWCARRFPRELDLHPHTKLQPRQDVNPLRFAPAQLPAPAARRPDASTHDTDRTTRSVLPPGPPSWPRVSARGGGDDSLESGQHQVVRRTCRYQARLVRLLDQRLESRQSETPSARRLMVVGGSRFRSRADLSRRRWRRLNRPGWWGGGFALGRRRTGPGSKCLARTYPTPHACYSRCLAKEAGP